MGVYGYRYPYKSINICNLDPKVLLLGSNVTSKTRRGKSIDIETLFNATLRTEGNKCYIIYNVS